MSVDCVDRSIIHFFKNHSYIDLSATYISLRESPLYVGLTIGVLLSCPIFVNLLSQWRRSRRQKQIQNDTTIRKQQGEHVQISDLIVEVQSTATRLYQAQQALAACQNNIQLTREDITQLRQSIQAEERIRIDLEMESSLISNEIETLHRNRVHHDKLCADLNSRLQCTLLELELRRASQAPDEDSNKVHCLFETMRTDYQKHKAELNRLRAVNQQLRTKNAQEIDQREVLLKQKQAWQSKIDAVFEKHDPEAENDPWAETPTDNKIFGFSPPSRTGTGVPIDDELEDDDDGTGSEKSWNLENELQEARYGRFRHQY